MPNHVSSAEFGAKRMIFSVSCGEAHSDDVEAALAAWEPSQLYLGQRLEAHGQALGNRSQFST
jgi:hypothetical protein